MKTQTFNIRDYGIGSDNEHYFMLTNHDQNGILREGIRISENELKKVYEFCKNVFKERTDEEIYRSMRTQYIKEDVLGVLQGAPYRYEEYIPQENWDNFAEAVAKRYAIDGDYDNNLSYWDNLDNLIDEEMGNFNVDLNNINEERE